MCPRRSGGWLSPLALALLLAAGLPRAQAGVLTVQTNVLGQTSSILGYNLGPFYPGSNTRDWFRYAGVTGARVFMGDFAIETNAPNPSVTNETTFLSQRAALRSDPLNTNYIDWPYITNRYATGVFGNLQPNYAFASLRQLGVQLLINRSASSGNFPISNPSDWSGKWVLWQHYYTLAFYLGREFDAERFQMYNEPDLSSETTSDFLMRLQLASDAIQCAQTDVNRIYGKTLTPTILAPVTAGQLGAYTTWGKTVVTNRHVNFLGQTDTNFWVFQKYDYHEYNDTPATFGSKLANIKSNLAIDVAPEPPMPVTLTEFNVHTAAVFSNTTDSLDTPTDYTALGGIVVNLAKNFPSELYCFKFSQTPLGDTVKKNGTHLVDNTNAPYNIGGVTKGGEVYRLFSKGFSPGRDLLGHAASTLPSSLYPLASHDPVRRRYSVFLANAASTTNVTLDTSAWSLPIGNPVLIEEVSETCSGGGFLLTNLPRDHTVSATQPSNTVWLVTIPQPPLQSVQTILAADDAMVKDGVNKTINYGASSVVWVKNNSTNANSRNVGFIRFQLPTTTVSNIQLAVLSVRASSINGAATVQAHVYGITNSNWSQSSITWSNAPNLAQGVYPGAASTNNFVSGAGSSAFLVGQLIAGSAVGERLLDVTDFVRSQNGAAVAFLLTREVRFDGDVQDNDGMQIVSIEGDPSAAPHLKIFRLLDSVGDGLPDSWRQQYFGGDGTTTNSQSCATCDASGTGQNNLFKYIAGLDPTNLASVFELQITGVTNQPTQNSLRFNPLATGRTYTPQFSTNLALGGWQPLTGYPGPWTNFNQVTITDTNAIEAQKYYRIRISLP